MREPNYIIDHFLNNKLPQIKKIMESDQFTDKDKLSAAMQLLNIDEIKFEHIPFLADKQAFLEYKYNLTHFELFSGKFNDQYWDGIRQFRELASQALGIIKQSPTITGHQNKYSKYAQGLSCLYQRTGMYESSSNKSNDITASVMPIGPKEFGVEPGFMAIHHQDVIIYLAEHFKHDNDSLSEFISMHNGGIGQVYDAIRDNLPEYLYKLNYKTEDEKLPATPGGTKVFLTEEDVKRTSKIKSSYKRGGEWVGDIAAKIYVKVKQSTALQINKEAILETLSNDFASMFMQVQKQKLFFTRYQNGALKLMPQAAWLNGSKQFGSEEEPLVGSKDDTHNYRGRKVIMSRNGITTVTDNSINNAARHLLPLLFTGDYDKIGSAGQNLLTVPGPQNEKTGQNVNHLVGIDFGHTLRAANPLIENKLIQADGRFSQPNNFFNNKPFKNFSVLTEGSTSEKMQGVLILAKLRGLNIDDDVIASYGNEFKQFYDEIPSGEGATLCDSYIAAIQDFQAEDYNNWDEYEEYIAAIQEFKNRMHQDMDSILNIFKGNLNRPAQAIDLADNFNKLCAAALGKTSLRSRDGSHGLEHIAINQDYRKTFDVMLNNDNHYTFSCSFSKNESDIIVAALKNRNLDNIALNYENGELTIRFHKIHLHEIVDSFNETGIKFEYHGQDSDDIEFAYKEIKLQDLIKAPWFEKNNIKMDLDLNPGNKNQYRIILYPADQKVFNLELADMISSQFQKPILNNQMIMDFDLSELSRVMQKLEELQKSYDAHLELFNPIVINYVVEKETIKQEEKILDQSEMHNAVEQEILEKGIDDIVTEAIISAEKEFEGWIIEQRKISMQKDLEETAQQFEKVSLNVPLTFFHSPLKGSDESESDEFSIDKILDFADVKSIAPIQHSDAVKLVTLGAFKNILRSLLETYEKAYSEESTANVASSYFPGTGRLYNFGRGLVNTVRPVAGTSSAIVLDLNKFIESEDPQNIEEIITILSTRKNYVENSLLQNNPVKYALEIKLLDQALTDGMDLVNEQKQSISVRNNGKTG